MKQENPVVLFIDDDRLMTDTIPFALEDLTGREVVACRSVDEAVEAGKAYNVGLVITDYYMGRNPAEVLIKLRETYPQVKVVCHTGSQNITLEHGYDAVVYKPKSLDGLVEIIKEELN
ncbi:TPA: response regulator transcription factor [Candidatus Woesearchaeota archaeon]|nr:response regulator transcription factor [Candidatus Woesearchaeota archaeon]